MAFCKERPDNSSAYRSREKFCKWHDDIEQGCENYLMHEDAWRIPLDDEPRYPKDADCEASYLSKRVFELYLNAQGCLAANPQTIVKPSNGIDNLLKYRGIKICGRPAEEDGFFFDIMNNPKPKTTDESRLAYAWHGIMKFHKYYHAIGNIGLLPEWLREGERSLNFKHADYGDRWDAFLQYWLLDSFRNGKSHMSLKRYIHLNCLYQYVLGFPLKLQGNWKTNDSNYWKGQLAEWQEQLHGIPENEIRVASVIDGKPLASQWEEEKGRVARLDEESRNRMDERICTLIEVRGRCITAVAKAALSDNR